MEEVPGETETTNTKVPAMSEITKIPDSPGLTNIESRDNLGANEATFENGKSGGSISAHPLDFKRALQVDVIPRQVHAHQDNLNLELLQAASDQTTTIAKDSQNSTSGARFKSLIAASEALEEQPWTMVQRKSSPKRSSPNKMISKSYKRLRHSSPSNGAPKVAEAKSRVATPPGPPARLVNVLALAPVGRAPQHCPAGSSL